MSALIVESCGAGTSLQDAGRVGWQRFGVSPSGAMDRPALAIANALVGNSRGACALEFTLMGGVFQVKGGPLRIALAGADCALSVGGRAVPAFTSATAGDGETVTVGNARAGLFAYLAAGGGFATRVDLGRPTGHRNGCGR